MAKKKYDAQLRETFYRKVNELLKQEYIPKPPRTLANEVVKSMLDGVAFGKPHPTLEAVVNIRLTPTSQNLPYLPFPMGPGEKSAF